MRVPCVRVLHFLLFAGHERDRREARVNINNKQKKKTEEINTKQHYTIKTLFWKNWRISNDFQWIKEQQASPVLEKILKMSHLLLFNSFHFDKESVRAKEKSIRLASGTQLHVNTQSYVLVIRCFHWSDIYVAIFFSQATHWHQRSRALTLMHKDESGAMAKKSEVCNMIHMCHIYKCFPLQMCPALWLQLPLHLCVRNTMLLLRKGEN